MGAHVELMTIPAGASVEDALLKVTGETELIGERKNDLWIRRVHVQGQWLGGDDFSFRTGNAKFGDTSNYLARMSGGEWLSPEKLLKARMAGCFWLCILIKLPRKIGKRRFHRMWN